MVFDFKSFVGFAYLALFRAQGTNYRLTPHRIGRILSFYALYSLFETLAWPGFLMDELFHRDYRRLEVNEPVFIVGNPRSGTTFLQRLLAKDGDTFTTPRLWEMMLAPSVTLRVVLQRLAAFDRGIGSPLRRFVLSAEERPQRGNVMHTVSLWSPEEDQVLLWHIWSTIMIWEQSAIVDGARRYVHFDTAMSTADRRRIMRFYRSCIQRHLYAHRGSAAPATHYLSKSPAFAPKIDTLYSAFPDARIIYVARNPLQVVPSYTSLLRYAWRFFGDPLGDGSCRDFVLETVGHWYRYPIQRLERASPDTYMIVKFEDLTHDPVRAVHTIYDHFGFHISPAYERELEADAERARGYDSAHSYSLEETGLTREQIVGRFADVFARFGFPEDIDAL